MQQLQASYPGCIFQYECKAGTSERINSNKVVRDAAIESKQGYDVFIEANSPNFISLKMEKAAFAASNVARGKKKGASFWYVWISVDHDTNCAGFVIV